MNKPNHPEEIGFGKWIGTKAGWHQGGALWMFLVYLTDVPGAVLLRHHPEWPLALRLLVSLVPLIAVLLYVRGLTRWIRGMDELHRPAVLQSFLFGTTAYLVLALLWPQLAQAGVFSALDLTRFHLEQMPFSNCTFAVCMTFILASGRYAVLNRRYQ